MYVALFLEIGLLLIVLPWSGFWEQNYFGHIWPPLQEIVTNNFVRGAVSGLGVVNLVAAFAELAMILTTRERPDMSLDEERRRSP